MLQPKFKLDRYDRLYVCDKYVSNGYWLLSKAILRKQYPQTPYKKMLAAPNGFYHRYAGTPDRPLTHDLAEIIPDRAGYEPLKPGAVNFVLTEQNYISSFIFESSQSKKTISVNPNYAMLFKLGAAFMRQKYDPILILTGNSLNDEFVGCVMPMRTNNKLYTPSEEYMKEHANGNQAHG
jgi:hypothetical protein